MPPENEGEILHLYFLLAPALKDQLFIRICYENSCNWVKAGVAEPPLKFTVLKEIFSC